MSVNDPFDDHVSADHTPFFKAKTGSGSHGELLWGDGVEVLESSGSRTRVRARGRNRRGWVSTSALGGPSLLELYFIDVGQGDGILIKTPDFRHVVIDGGYRRRAQNTLKSAADFIDWKFFHDYALDTIELEAMVASHCDADHYGGLHDLLDLEEAMATPEDPAELDTTTLSLENFYHAGVGWWRPADRWLGPKQQAAGRWYLTQLMGDRQAVMAALVPGAQPELQGWWAEFMAAVVESETRGGINHPPITRISNLTGYLPGFAPNGGAPTMKVLAPIETTLAGGPALPSYGSPDSLNTNGNSVTLRLDYGRTRILLTGDLNRAAHRRMLEAYEGQRQELECDVAKACHHGSDDVSYEFLQTIRPAVTVICSGDNEKHDHPRPTVVAASATTGFLKIENDEIISPLVYSTELARSVSIGHPFKLDLAATDANPPATVDGDRFERSLIHYEERKPGEFNPKKKQLAMKRARVVAGLVYGLVNVRSDGDRVLTAVMNEADGSFQTQVVESRF